MKKREPKILYVLIPGGIICTVLSGAILAIHYVGFPNDFSVPVIAYVLLPLGLLLAAAGHRVLKGRWNGVAAVLHMKLAYAALAFTGVTVKYVLAGKSVRMYPVGVLLVISGLFYVSRLLMRWVAADDY
ncbi:MAG: hypothetical protein ACRD2U_14135 [Terriglobales bacterium]